MKIMYILMIILLFMAFAQCSNKQMLLPGKYRESQNLRNYNHQIELFADSTFVFKYLVGSRTERYSEGKWKQKNKSTIILNSDVQNKWMLDSVRVMPSKNKRNIICVNLEVPNKDLRDYICYPILNDDIFTSISSLDRGSYCFYPETLIEKIYFNIEKRPLKVVVLGLSQPTYNLIRSEEILLDSQKGDSIIVNLQVSDSLFSYRIFENVEIKLKKENITFKDIDNSKTHKLKLIKYPPFFEI